MGVNSRLVFPNADDAGLSFSLKGEGDLGSLEDPLRDIYRIPLPRLSIVRRKCLAPYRQLRVSHIPSEQDDDCLPFVRVAPKKMPNTVVKGPSHWRIEHIAAAVGPIDFPKSGLSVEQ